MADDFLMRNSPPPTGCWGYNCFEEISSTDPVPSQLEVDGSWWITVAIMTATVILTSLICFFVGQKTIQCRYKAQLIRDRETLEKGLKERKKFVEEKLPVEKWNEELELHSEDHSCSICIEKYKIGDKISTSLEDINNQKACQHCFHSRCIGEWLWSNSECPICRTIFLGRQESQEFLMRNKEEDENDEEDPQAEVIASAQQEQQASQRRQDGWRASNVARVERSSNRPSSDSLKKTRQPRAATASGRVRSNIRPTDPLDEISDDESESMSC